MPEGVSMTKSSDTPVLSVVVPSFNQARFLGENLSELLAYPGQVQAIVMDGGSRDGSAEMLERLLGNSHIWRSGPDGGQSAAINEGFSKATGAWVAFQNSDDFYVPGSLGPILNLMQTTDADLIIGGAAACDVDGTVFKTMTPKPIFYPCMSVMNFINNQSLFVRRSYLEKIGYLDPSLRFCLDYEWFLRLLRGRPKIVLLYDTVGVQRMHEDTKTSNIKHIHDQEFSELRMKYFSFGERLLGKFSIGAYRVFRFLWPVLVRRNRATAS